MTTDVEDGVELAGASGNVGELNSVGPEGLVVLEEVLGGGVGLEHLHGALVEGSNAALGGGDGDLSLLGENIVGVGELGLLIVLESFIGVKLLGHGSPRSLQESGSLPRWRGTYQVPASRSLSGNLVVRGEDNQNLGCHYEELICVRLLKIVTGVIEWLKGNLQAE